MDCVDVYSGVCPRPGPDPAGHDWWMAAGAVGRDGGGAGTRSETITILPLNLSGDGLAPDGGEVVEDGNSDNLSLGDEADNSRPPSSSRRLRSGVAGTEHGGGHGRSEGEGEGGRDGASADGLGSEKGVLSSLDCEKTAGRA